MSKTKDQVIDDLNEQLGPELRDVMEEWQDVTQEVKAVILRTLTTLSEDSNINRIHFVSAVTSLSLAIGQLIALMENEEMEDSLMNAFSEGVKLAVMKMRLYRLEGKESKS